MCFLHAQYLLKLYVLCKFIQTKFPICLSISILISLIIMVYDFISNTTENGDDVTIFPPIHIMDGGIYSKLTPSTIVDGFNTTALPYNPNYNGDNTSVFLRLLVSNHWVVFHPFPIVKSTDISVTQCLLLITEIILLDMGYVSCLEVPIGISSNADEGSNGYCDFRGGPITHIVWFGQLLLCVLIF